MQYNNIALFSRFVKGFFGIFDFIYILFTLFPEKRIKLAKKAKNKDAAAFGVFENKKIRFIRYLYDIYLDGFSECKAFACRVGRAARLVVHKNVDRIGVIHNVGVAQKSGILSVSFVFG